MSCQYGQPGWVLKDASKLMSWFSPTFSGVFISARHGDAGDVATSPTLKNRPLFGQKFSTFGQSMQLHSRISEVVSIFPRQYNGQINGKIIAKTAKLIYGYFAILFCTWWQNRHCPWVNWNHVVIPIAFIKFGPTKTFIQVLGKIRNIWVN